MKIVIIDDEHLARQVIESYVESTDNVEIIASLENPLELLPILENEDVDLLFIDIQMPQMMGNKLIRSLANPPLFVFTTAYTEFAVEAFELDSFDYLLKPFSLERFQKTIEKVQEALVLNKKDKDTEDYFIVRADGETQKVFYQDILYIESDREYVKIYSINKRIMYLDTMKRLELILPESQFLRVHKSFIIHKQKATSISGNQLKIADNLIPVSRSRKAEVVDKLFGQV